jgi:hypothetical protein
MRHRLPTNPYLPIHQNLYAELVQNRLVTGALRVEELARWLSSLEISIGSSTSERRLVKLYTAEKTRMMAKVAHALVSMHNIFSSIIFLITVFMIFWCSINYIVCVTTSSSSIGLPCKIGYVTLLCPKFWTTLTTTAYTWWTPAFVPGRRRCNWQLMRNGYGTNFCVYYVWSSCGRPSRHRMSFPPT